MASSQKAEPDAGRGRCPICGAPIDSKTADPKARPFCSKRCADIDLARWLSGSYVIAGGQADADEDGDQASAQGALPSAEGRGEDEDR